jgi:cytochrome c
MPIHRPHLLQAGLVWLLLAVSVLGSETADALDPARFEKEIIVSGASDPMQFEVLSDGRIYFIEITGRLKFYRPETGTVQVVGEVPVARFSEVGLMGMKLDPDFDRTQLLYLFFCPQEKNDRLRVSRFKLQEGMLDVDSEIVMLEYPIDSEGASHMGGGMFMDAQGDLYIGTGDNCTPIPELPVDQRQGQERLDALRSSGNTNDLRGKVLRIHPEEEGSYTIPEGNLFPDGQGGRAEIYAMGCRNPFRLYVDPQTSWLYWGDVGPNIRLDLQIGPNGYDEINQARMAGNFGWPMFVGPNEAYRWWNFEEEKPGPWFEVDQPINSSRNNTGARLLPAPKEAFIWYPTTESEQFPELGSGGRSAMAGPIYHYDPDLQSDLKLPADLDGKLFIYEWTRNWIKTVQLDENGDIQQIEPFLGHLIFRKPIDMKFRDDGTLYLIEYGDKWVGNDDAQIVRIVYRRGNRPPVAVVRADRIAGKHPLGVYLDGTGSHDKDQKDQLQFAWRIGDRPVEPSREANVDFTFEKPGNYPVVLTVTDRAGATDETRVEIRVGNAPPVVEILEPPHGSFFSWEEPILYRCRVEDEEDGAIGPNHLDSSRVVVRAKYQQRRHSTISDAQGQQLLIDDSTVEPGLALMRRTTCFSCHMSQSVSAGPPYLSVAKKYEHDDSAHATLAKKIVTGGSGVWGAKPMPPHPQHTEAETRLMVDWILSLAMEGSDIPMPGAEGAFRTRSHPDARSNAGVYVVTANYTDSGADGAPPITGETVHALHSRHKKAAFFDARQGVDIVDEYEGEQAIVGRFADGDYVSFKDIRLAGIDSVTMRAGALGDDGGSFELHCDAPDGPLLAEIDLPPSTGYHHQRVSIQDPGGLIDLYVVARTKKQGADKSLGLNWLHFHDSESAELARAERKQAAEEILQLKSASANRPFVRNWVVEDLADDLTLVDQERSFKNGQQIFQTASCVACHRMGTSGGKLGPDLSQIAERMAKRQKPRLELLKEIIEPSSVVADDFRTYLITTTEGQQLSGMIIAKNDAEVQLATNPLVPDQITELKQKDLESITPLQQSLMPEGLLSTFTRDDILDLLAYLEAGGNEQHPAFRKEPADAP